MMNASCTRRCVSSRRIGLLLTLGLLHESASEALASIA